MIQNSADEICLRDVRLMRPDFRINNLFLPPSLWVR